MRHSLIVAALAAALVTVASGCQIGGSSGAPEGEPTTTAPSSASVPGRGARASFENGFAACRRAQNIDALHFAPAPGEDRNLHARRYLDRMRRIVRENLREGNDFGVALQGCLEAAWPEGVSVPQRSLRTLVGGERLTFPPGVVRRGETLVCISDNRRGALPIPPPGQAVTTDAEVGFNITTLGDRTVIAECQ